MKHFYLRSNDSLHSKSEKLLPLDFVGETDVIYLAVINQPPSVENFPTLPSYQSGGGFVGFNPLSSLIVPPTTFIAFPSLSLKEEAVAVWETLNEYVYDIIDQRCKLEGFKDYKDVIDSATNEFLPLEEQTQARWLRQWWGAVWTAAYQQRDKILVADHFFKIKSYIEELNTTVPFIAYHHG